MEVAAPAGRPPIIPIDLLTPDQRYQQEEQGQGTRSQTSHCDDDGNFLPQQCSGSTGYCWCVDTITGEEIQSTKTAPGVRPVNCGEWFCLNYHRIIEPC
uniref:Thyroglobulin type-1 domain-containing protein n=1 Tax=Poecilia mexicana TaxID=48701 RepID=A0A3B3WM87_9TELE